jgi:uncharacterized protein (TIGR03085 family)
MPDLDLRERAELCDLFLRLGPDAPTLCDGWTTRHLAAHLSLRERDIRAVPGILFGGPLGRYSDKLLQQEMRRVFDNLVARVRHPAPGPLSIAAIRAAISFVEYLVHHEDVRRANGEGPRTDRPDLQAEAWKQLGRLAKLMAFKARTGRTLELVATGTTTGTRRVGKGPVVTLTGEPVELLLYLEGRGSAALITKTGAAADIAAVDAGKFGV